MEVLRENQKPPAVLCNYEVFKLLNDLKGKTTQNQASSHLATVLYEALHYLQDSPCSKQTDSDIEEVLKALKNFPVQLTKREKLMIINNPPKSQLQLSSIIKDVEDRLSEEQTEELLQIISKHLDV